MKLDEALSAHVPYHSIGTVKAAVLACDDLTTTDERNAAVKKELDWQHHWAERAGKAESEAHRLRGLIDLASAQRAIAVMKLAEDVGRPSRTAKHDETCHVRHAACLAARIIDALNGADT